MEAESAERMARIYARVFVNLNDELRRLADDLAGLDEISLGRAMRLARTRRILEQIGDEVARFGGVVEGEIVNIQGQALQLGIDDAIDLMEASLPPLPEDTGPALVRSFTRLHTDAVETAAGLLGDDSPLIARLRVGFGPYVTEQVAEHLTDGIAVGMNPRRIARLLNRNVQGGLGRGLTSVLTTIRTAQVKSYQLSNHITYAANENIVPEWVWHAQLRDDRTCMSCISKHGSVHPITEQLNDHHNGRCAPVPKAISYAALGINLPDRREEIETGESWFRRQTEARQRELMKPGKFTAWQNGEFEFSELSKPYDDEVYGELLREATLKELLK